MKVAAEGPLGGMLRYDLPHGIVTLIVLGRKGPHGFPFRRVRSKYSADPQVSIVQQVVTVTANRSQPWLSPNVFPLCV